MQVSPTAELEWRRVTDRDGTEAKLVAALLLRGQSRYRHAVQERAAGLFLADGLRVVPRRLGPIK